MRRALTALSFTVAALVAAAAFFIGFTLPPRAERLTASIPATVVFGAYHVHTARSDGTGTVDDIARAASRAGLKFVILTDHGDLARAPDPPAYRDGVLVLDAAEINTLAGHVVALNVRQPSPYPLAGEARDVIEDIHRLGGWAVIAHSDSPKPDLRWRGQNLSADGIEWINADSEWRDDRPSKLLAVAARSIFRAPEAVLSLFARPAATLQRWDMALRSRPLFSLAAVDAHASIPWSEGEEPRRRTALAQPSYYTMFRTLQQGVELDQPLSGDPAADADRVWQAIGAGRSFSIAPAIAGPAILSFDGEVDGVVIRPGESLETGATAPVLRAHVPGVPSAHLTLLRNGQPVSTGQGSVKIVASQAGAYRVEAFYRGSAFPWLVSNAIRVGPTEVLPPPTAAEALPLIPVGADLPWHTEHDPTSTAAFDASSGGVQFRFRLGAGVPAGQFAAVASDVQTDEGIERINFTARASRPMRLSVQVRLRNSPNGARWQRSIYVDETPRPISIAVRDLEKVENSSTLRPIVARLHAVLFVVDTLNTLPGTDGTVWLTNLNLGVGKIE